MSSIDMIEKVIENEQPNPPFVGIVCHPHTLQGGTMNNKVVTTLTRTIRELGGTAIRFNFREFDHGVSETADTILLVNYARTRWPHAKIWLAGFSFGAYVSLCAATQTPVSQLISVAPAVNHGDFSHLHPHCPWIVVIAEDDEVVPAQDIHDWIATRDPKPTVIEFTNTSHFFHGELINLRNALIEALKNADAR